MADCASVEDVRTAVEAGADGVGLLLSEYLLLAGRVNGEEEQYGFLLPVWRRRRAGRYHLYL